MKLHPPLKQSPAKVMLFTDVVWLSRFLILDESQHKKVALLRTEMDADGRRNKEKLRE